MGLTAYQVAVLDTANLLHHYSLADLTDLTGGANASKVDTRPVSDGYGFVALGDTQAGASTTGDTGGAAFFVYDSLIHPRSSSSDLQFTGTSAFSVVMFARVWGNPDTGYRRLFSNETAAYETGICLASQNTVLVFARGNGGSTGAVERASTSALAGSTWTHIACTYDGANMKLYVNGSLKTTTATTRSLSSTAQRMALGARPHNATVDSFLGHLDEVSFFSRALSATEISGLYDARDDAPDTTAPIVNRLSGAAQTVSASAPYAFDFQPNERCKAWKVKLASSASSLHTEGVLIESGGALAANTSVTGTITAAELQTAGLAEGASAHVRFFTQDLAGNWST